MVMRLVLLCLSVLVFCADSPAQSKWLKVRVGNELSVKFPEQPNVDSKPDRRLTLYVFKSHGSECMFSVVVREDATADYARIRKLPNSER